MGVSAQGGMKTARKRRSRSRLVVVVVIVDVVVERPETIWASGKSSPGR